MAQCDLSALVGCVVRPVRGSALAVLAMQLLVLFTVVIPVVALRNAPAAAPASSPIAAPAAAAPQQIPHVAETSAVPINKSANVVKVTSKKMAVKDINRSPSKFNNDTLSEEAFDAAEPAFSDLDCIKRDSVITINEAATFGVKNGVPWSEIKPIFEILDANQDGSITKEEFNKNTTLHQKMLEDLRPGFKDIDLDGDNLISLKEWMAFCNGWMTPHPTENTCTALFLSADTTDPEGEVDPTEFEHAGKQCHSVDDGDCDPPSKGKAALLQVPRKSVALAESVRRSATHTGAALFALLVRRHLKD